MSGCLLNKSNEGFPVLSGQISSFYVQNAVPWNFLFFLALERDNNPSRSSVVTMLAEIDAVDGMVMY